MEMDMVVEEQIFTEVGQEGELYLPETFVITCGRLTLRKSPTKFDPDTNKKHVTNSNIKSRNLQTNITEITEHENDNSTNEENRCRNLTDIITEITEHENNNGTNEEERNGNLTDIIKVTTKHENNNAINKQNRCGNITNVITEMTEHENNNVTNEENKGEILTDRNGDDPIKTANPDNRTRNEKFISEMENENRGGEKDWSGTVQDRNNAEQIIPDEQNVKKREVFMMTVDEEENKEIFLEKELETVDEESAMEEQSLTKNPGHVRNTIPVIEEPGERRRFRGVEAKRMERMRRRPERNIVKNSVVIEEMNENFDCQYEEVMEPIVDEGVDIEEIPSTRETVDIMELIDEIDEQEKTIKNEQNPEESSFGRIAIEKSLPHSFLNERTEQIAAVITERAEERLAGEEWVEHRDCVASVTEDDVTEADDSSRCAEEDEREVVRKILEEYGPGDSGEQRLWEGGLTKVQCGGR